MTVSEAQATVHPFTLRVGQPRSHANVALDGASKAVTENLRRLQRLTHAGVMQILAVADSMQLGFARQAMIGIRCAGDTTKVAAQIAALQSVNYVVLTAGSFDVIVEVLAEDHDGLLHLLNSHIRTLPGVASTETLVHLKTYEQQYNWGIR